MAPVKEGSMRITILYVIRSNRLGVSYGLILFCASISLTHNLSVGKVGPNVSIYLE
jgi:hypothetical protein